MSTLSVVVAARDEETMLPGCLSRLGFADEVVVVLDSRSADRTGEIAASFGAVLVTSAFDGFAALKNTGLAVANSDWVMIVDADERVSTALAAEVKSVLSSTQVEVAYRVRIQNHFYGRRMRHGGWSSERPIRLFRRAVARYQGLVHERLVLPPGATLGELASPLVHFSHRSIVDNLRKSAQYVEGEATDLVASGHPRVTPWSVARAVGREFAWRTLKNSGWRDGVPGLIEAAYQPFSVLAVQIRIWELQQSPSVPERYALLDEQIP